MSDIIANPNVVILGEFLDSTEGAKLTRQQDFAIWAAESKDQ